MFETGSIWEDFSSARLGHIKLTDMGLAKVSVGKCLDWPDSGALKGSLLPEA